jgi:hypothetical protein
MQEVRNYPPRHHCVDANPIRDRALKDKATLDRISSYQNNNYVFNGRNLTTHEHINPTIKRCQTKKPELDTGVFIRDQLNANMVTHNILNHLYSDTNGMEVAKNPSNLVSAPKINEKYESSTSHSNPSHLNSYNMH